MTTKSVHLFIYVVLCVAWLVWKWRGGRSQAQAAVLKPPERQKLRPRTPKSCADCQNECVLAVQEQCQVTPWREVKSRRGRKKQIDTEGYACWNEQGPYYGVTDAQVHALVGYGRHRKGDRIQDLFCQACHTKVSERRGTALYRLKTPAAQVSQVLAMLAEGLDVSAAERVSGHAQATIQCWLTRAGMHSERLHLRLFQGLKLVREKAHEQWVWVTTDVLTKLVPVLEVGPRTQAMANSELSTVSVGSAGCEGEFGMQNPI